MRPPTEREIEILIDVFCDVRTGDTPEEACRRSYITIYDYALLVDRTRMWCNYRVWRPLSCVILTAALVLASLA